MNILPHDPGPDKAHIPGRVDFYVQFESAGMVMAVEYSFIREVIFHQAPVAVPLAPSYLTGVINYSGQVCPVVSLNAANGLKEGAVSGKTCILMLEPPENTQILIGLTAESFLGSVKILPDRIAGAPAATGGVFDGCMAGTAMINNIETVILRPHDFLKKLDFISINN